MTNLRRIAVCVLCALGALLPVQFLGVTAAQAVTFTNLTLLNGWTGGPFGTGGPSVANIGGIVHFRGAIATSGSNPEPFVLPASFRPAVNVFVPVDLCNATNGRLDIAPSGVVDVEAEGGTFANAQCFTSLDGVTFALSATGFTGLSPQNGWTNAPFGTSSAAVRNISGVVRFKGAVASGTSGVLFTLPASFRPATAVYVPVDLCDATNGRLFIRPDGTVTVQQQSGDPFSNAQCFTSLDGASFALSAAGYTGLTLQNGWTGGPFGTSAPAASDVSGVIQLEGAISTSGTNPVAFTLPQALAPTSDTYVKVDLCNATNGRLHIAPSGVVDVEAEGGTFANAQCFTSLDGVSFVPGGVFGKLTLVNGWTGAPFGTSGPAASVTGGIVQLSGAMSTTGTNPVAFTLPAADRPSTSVFVPVDLCDATNGRLDIAPSGVVTVQQQDSGFADAQCFTSLEGVSFATSATGFTGLTLQNGWTNAPFGTANAAVTLAGGIVRLRGAVASGTSPVLFTLPAGFRPATDVYVPVDLCNATNGRLHIQPDGVADVQVPSTESFADAQCFTSLDGVSFAPSATSFTGVTLQNGWTNAPFSTAKAAVALVGGVVHLKGAVASGTSAVLFTLPARFRPARAAYAKVDLCDATNGRLFIQPDGTVTVQQQSGDPFSNAQCFTSLDGASFAP
jgi:hypothetical protein